MSTHPCRFLRLLPLIVAAFSSSVAQGAGAAATAAAVLGVMEHVADWQLANPSQHPATDWTQGAGSAGMMALAGISGSPRFRDAERAMGEEMGWQPGARMYHADDHCIAQTYAELYFLYRENAMLVPLRARFDSILAAPSKVGSLNFKKTSGDPTENWSWCDSLFMGPPTWMRLYAATGEAKYMDFAVRNWWRTSDYLYDKDEHLFFRDSTYFDRREANGRKVFWSRGNGWVMAGLARTLQYLPSNHPDRSRLEKQFREMASTILACQQPDSLWRASLLDPASYPMKETSGSGFYVFALAWGVNQGLLDRAAYGGAVESGWNALTQCVSADGKLTHVQPIGADPRKFAEDATEVYGVGAFLLAGSEVYRAAVLAAAGHEMAHVAVTNPAPFWRENETVELRLTGTGIPRNPAVMDSLTSRILPSQVYTTSEETSPTLLFQVDLAPGESRKVVVVDQSALAAMPVPIVKTFARQISERFNDIAWESDRTAHRTYQLALIKGEGTLTSGMDVWSKRTRGLVVDEWYRNRDYHNDHGHGMDDYHVGRSRGNGGLGIWDGSALYVSKNFRDARVVTTGPLRSEFTLTYDSWDASGRSVSEVKRISIDAGSNMSRATSVFTTPDAGPLTIGIGIAGRPGAGGVLAQSKDEGWMTYWQPPDRNRGNIGCALLAPDGISGFATDTASITGGRIEDPTKPGAEGYPPVSNELLVTTVNMGIPFTYYFGASWSLNGDFPTEASWEKYVQRFGERLKSPIRVSVSN